MPSEPSQITVTTVGTLCNYNKHHNNHPTPPTSEFAKTMKAHEVSRHRTSSSSNSFSPSKLPPKIPVLRNHINNGNTKSSLGSPSGSRQGLPYPLSHQSTLSQAGKRAFGKTGSPAEGGGSLSTTIAVGTTEDLSSLTKPAGNRGGSARDQSQSPPPPLPLTFKNLAISQQQQYRQ